MHTLDHDPCQWMAGVPTLSLSPFDFSKAARNAVQTYSGFGRRPKSEGATSHSPRLEMRVPHLSFLSSCIRGSLVEMYVLTTGYTC